MLILMGPSASGKTEIAKILDSEYNLKKVVTHTTRAKRNNEIPDIDYHFVAHDDFILMYNNNEFVETTVYNNNYYGTSKKEIGDDKCIVLDPNGAMNFKRLNIDNLYIVYLQCDQNIRIARMQSRGDSDKNIESRIKSDVLSFNDNAKTIADHIIDSSSSNPHELAQIIYNLYKNFLNN